MKLFRAQRNFYVAGFALFLYLVIRRLVQLINDYARVIADQKASLSQAQSATQALNSYLADGDKKESENDDELSKLKKNFRPQKKMPRKRRVNCTQLDRNATILPKNTIV